MVARGQKRRRQALEDRAAVVVNLTGLSVIDCTGTDDAPAEGFADRLMSQTDAEQWDLPGKPANDFERDPGAAGCSRPGRDHNALGPQPGDFFDADLIVATHDELLAELAQILRQVVGKRIVVVDQQNQRPPSRRPGSASRRAKASARALFTVSSYSRSGT